MYSFDIYALIFLFVGILGSILTIIALIICSKRQNGFKVATAAVSVFAFIFLVVTILCSAKAIEGYHYTIGYHDQIISSRRDSSSYFAVVFGIVTVAFGIIAFILSLIAKVRPNVVIEENQKQESSKESETSEFKAIEESKVEEIKPVVIAEKAESNIVSTQSTNIAIEQTKEPKVQKSVEVTKLPTKDLIILTASSNTGIGLWTSICVGCAAIFGVQSKKYKFKMNKILNEIKSDLESQMAQYKEYEFKDYRIIREKGLAYYGTVIGTRKPN